MRVACLYEGSTPAACLNRLSLFLLSPAAAAAVMSVAGVCLSLDVAVCSAAAA